MLKIVLYKIPIKIKIFLENDVNDIFVVLALANGYVSLKNRASLEKTVFLRYSLR